MSPGQEVAEPHPPRGAWRLIAIAVAAVAIAAFVVIFGNPFAASGGASDGHQGNSYPTQMATVLKQNLTSQTAVNGTLGYAGDYNVVNQAAGTFTALPAAGDIVRSGDVLYRLDGRPVVLLAGSTPGYR
jgi:multidrug efflux pump subunit AcrA (membrane-fusion protein)